MGLYDTVIVPCPKCGKEEYFQSKGGECLLRTYTLENCPRDVLSDVNRHAPYMCDNCGNMFEVDVSSSRGQEDDKVADTDVGNPPTYEELVAALRESTSVLRWMMDNTTPDSDWQTFTNSGMNAITEGEQLLERIK